jgi:glutathione S-transferase
VTAALVALGYYEMLDEERPPEEIWHHHERITRWMEEVKERRSNPDMQPVDAFDEPGGDVQRNELYDELKNQVRK